VDPQVPDWLEDITLRAMAKDRDQRYQSSAEMRADIQRGLAGMPTQAGTMAMAAAGATTTLPPAGDRYGDRYDDGYDDYDDYEDEKKNNTGKIVLWSLLGLGVVASIILVFFLMNREPPAAETAAVPDVVGASAEDAQAELEEAGFTGVSVEQRADPEAEEGSVVETDPAAGEEIALDDPIVLYVSSGPDAQEIPSVEGQSQSDAQNTLSEAGFTNVTVEEQNHDSIAAGTAINTDPPAGDAVAPDAAIRLLVSSGPGNVAVPDLQGMTREQAEAALQGVGLTASFHEVEDAANPPNTVISQSIPANQEVAPDTTVTVTVAIAPAQQPDPPTDTDPPTPPDNGGETPPEGEGQEQDGFAFEPALRD
jgi:eukaryotic-like serine/threonine-protein kinase